MVGETTAVSVYDAYEIVIGLECHVQLSTRSKLFSPAPNRYGDLPNTNVDVVDAGLPGVLPVMNGAAVRHAVALGTALGAQVRRRSVFARKHYFYPDLPKGYQVSQYDLPIVHDGAITIDVDGAVRTIRIERAHLEEDAGKNLHGDAGYSLCDYNRAGTPLLEVVTAPDMRSPEEAMALFRELRRLVVWLGVCDGNLDEGSMRADCNVSVRKKGSDVLGTRTETKNINSIRYVGDAIAFEARRQVQELEAGRAIVQETRLWDPDRQESRSMRGKEEAHDYRYFPDPDLPPLVVTEDEIAAVVASLPELPRVKAARFVSALGLSLYDAGVLCADRDTADYFERALAAHGNAKGVANWVINEALRAAKQKAGDGATASASGIPPEALAGVVALVDAQTITGKVAKDVFAELVAGRGTDPAQIVADRGWQVVRDEGALAQAVEDVLAANAAEVAKYLAGKDKVLGFLTGAVMKATRGKAQPADVNRALAQRLAALKAGKP